MNVNVENTSTLGRKLTIEIEPDEIKSELSKAYNELRRGVQLKGFRPGHAPQKILERLFGDQVRGDVIQRLIKEYTGKALEEHQLKPIVEPQIVTEEADLAKRLCFSAAFDIKPEITVKDYETLKVPKPAVEVSEADIDAAVERIRERSAVLKRVEERTAVNAGDFVLAKIEAWSDGKPLAAFKSDERLFNVSKDALAHGVDEILAGAEIGKETRATRSYPTDYSSKDLAGRTIEWRATVTEIMERKLPALDDEFAKDQGEYQNLAEMREHLRRQLLDEAREQADARARQGLLELIVERNPIELPASLVDRERAVLESELESMLESSGMPHDQARARVQQEGGELAARAEKRARNALITDALADQEHIEVGDEELGDRVAAVVTRAGRDRNRLAEFYGEERNREALRQSMRRENVLDALLARAQAESATSKPAAGA